MVGIYVRFFAFAFLVIISLNARLYAEKIESADSAFYNGGIYTGVGEPSWVESIAVHKGLIVAIGSNDQIKSYVGPMTRTVNLKNQMLIPGFSDVHVHGLQFLSTSGQCDLRNLAGVNKKLARVKECVARVSPGEWIQGGGGGISKNLEINYPLRNYWIPYLLKIQYF